MPSPPPSRPLPMSSAFPLPRLVFLLTILTLAAAPPCASELSAPPVVIVRPAALHHTPLTASRHFLMGLPRYSLRATEGPLAWLPLRLGCPRHSAASHTNATAYSVPLRSEQLHAERTRRAALAEAQAEAMLDRRDGAAERSGDGDNDDGDRRGPFAGKIVLTERGVCSFRDKALEAQRRGAAGLLVATEGAAAVEMWGTVDDAAAAAAAAVHVRVASINAAAYERILAAMWLTGTEVVVRLGFGLTQGMVY